MKRAPKPAQALLSALTNLLWVHAPLKARRLSSTLGEALLDGYALVALGPAAGALSVAVFIAGLWTGATHRGPWGFETVFTQSLSFMIAAAAIGAFSAHLGAMLVLGFALGDFFLAHPSWQFRGALSTYLLSVRVPLLIQYSLLALLAVQTPIVVKGLVSQLVPKEARGRFARYALATVAVPVALAGTALLTSAFTYFWTQAAPLLIRPVFTGIPANGSPPVSAMVILQSPRAGLIVQAAVTAAILRIAWQALTALWPPFRARLERHEAHFQAARPSEPLHTRLTRWPAVLLVSAWSTVMLAGMLHNNRRHWVTLFLLFFVTQVIRSGLVPNPLGPWAAAMERVWVPLRVGIVFLITTGVSATVLANPALGLVLLGPPAGNTFQPLVTLTAVGALIAFVFLPGASAPRPRERAAEAPAPVRQALPVGQPA